MARHQAVSDDCFFLISWAACLSGLDYSCRRTERQEKGGRASLALACLLGGRSPVCKGNMGKKVARPSTELVQTEGRAKAIFFGGGVLAASASSRHGK